MRYPYDPLFLVCTGARCNDERHGEERGEKIRETLKDLNSARGRKNRVRICATSCLDLCDHGPNLIAEPSGTVYSHLTRARAVEVYAGVMKDGPLPEGLALDEAEFRSGGSKAARPALNRMDEEPDGRILKS